MKVIHQYLAAYEQLLPGTSLKPAWVKARPHTRGVDDEKPYLWSAPPPLQYLCNLNLHTRSTLCDLTNNFRSYQCPLPSMENCLKEPLD